MGANTTSSAQTCTGQRELHTCLGDSALGRCLEGAAARTMLWRVVPRLCPASAWGWGGNPGSPAEGSPADGRQMPPMELEPSRSELG